MNDVGAESSVRDDVMAAMEGPADTGSDSGSSAEVASSSEVAAPAVETPKAVSGRDTKGRFAPGRAPPVPIGSTPFNLGKGTPVAKPEAQGVPEEKSSEKATPTVTATLKAPASWKPAAREKWAALPPEVQQETLRREHEMSRTLSETAEARKGYAAFQRVVQPFESMIRAEGAQPLQAVESLLRESVIMRQGSPLQRAQIVARTIRQWGVPVEAVAAALDGQPMPQVGGGHPVNVEEMVDRALKARVAQAEEYQNRKLITKATTTIDKFAGDHEFFDDVSEDFQLVLEAMGRRNPELEPDLEEVYARAVAMNPVVAQIVAQRQAAKAQATGGTATQRARVAASSVRSTPAGNTHTGEPKSIRDEVAALYAQHET
jgi:hypothetical protein